MGTPAITGRTHSSCFKDEPCAVGKPETCPAAHATAVREAALAGRWSRLELREGGGRHLLDGEPIHCGTALELQAMEFRTDDYGEYRAVLQRGIRVRYELSGSGSLDERVVLHVTVDGHDFTSPLEKWMCFRWPVRAPNAR